MLGLWLKGIVAYTIKYPLMVSAISKAKETIKSQNLISFTIDVVFSDMTVNKFTPIIKYIPASKIMSSLLGSKKSFALSFGVSQNK